ncbi:hypothetical protein F0562_027646 [Nyssa sinensis]|uniref:Uncharacterized protein n=1 Tax=Nyssa sinensis TaxID=561372 RepID=A0A5J5B5G5_9ASTE|nr:hypothetical protein F0562_027646 [Nyssa sinensis]
MSTPTVRHISECFIKPQYAIEESKQPIYLAPWDLAMLSVHYIQKGLLFPKPPAVDHDPEDPVKALLEKLKHSLSLALVHFYPLAGRLATLKQENPPLYSVFIDCSDSPGARFIYAALNLTISDILSPTDVPLVVQSFFDHDRAINHDGHTMSLLSIQVTELIDGIFIGCSINHMAVDGTSYWHFFNMWSEILKTQGENTPMISRPPIHKHWAPDGHGPVISLPFTHHDQFISRHEAPKLRERIFHFSTESLAKLKSKGQCGIQFQQNLLFAGLYLRLFGESPFIYQLGQFFDPLSVMMGSSPRFDMYGNEFGLGKALAIRSGYANKFDGKVTLYPGHEGGGSMDLEICLSPDLMRAFESDEEFLDAMVSSNVMT